MAVDWTHELVDQLDFYMQHHFRPRMQGLTDDEYFWEPVADCWSVRPQADDTFGMDAAVGMDNAPTRPPPFTTIAWRLSHIGAHVLGMRATNHFSDRAWSFDDVEWPGSASDGLAFVEDAYAAWKAGIESLGDEGLAAAVGPAEGPFAAYPYASLILHINREVIHHGAEVCCLRDLYHHQVVAAR